MNDQIINRVLQVAHYFLKTKGTVRSIAKNFGVSKSTIHKDLTERLLELDKNTYIEVRELLDYNKSVRHIRGGKSTKMKYLKQIS
ncbi:MAG TPA: sporulation transcriptional regulator SpoIIID [Haloplasmataceae bacterium]